MKKNIGAFTILELIIVIIIIGVLASLALPRLFRMIERAEAVEAIAMLSTIRRQMDTCFLMNNEKSYILTSSPLTLCQPDYEQINTPNSKFLYAIFDYSLSKAYAGRATRKDGTHQNIIYFVQLPNGSFQYCGGEYGIYKGIGNRQPCPGDKGGAYWWQ